MLWRAAAEVLQNKMEESDDKEMVLGQDLVNPFTGGVRWGSQDLFETIGEA